MLTKAFLLDPPPNGAHLQSPVAIRHWLSIAASYLPAFGRAAASGRHHAVAMAPIDLVDVVLFIMEVGHKRQIVQTLAASSKATFTCLYELESWRKF